MHSTIRPTIKSTVRFYSMAQRIYFSTSGEAIEMDDPTGFMMSLCQAMDGHKNIQALETQLKKTYPDQIQYISDALNALDNAYLIEDVNAQDTSGLTNYDLERWSRNSEFFSAYLKSDESKHALQARLKSVKVALLGLGGLGSHILYDLVALGVQHIRAADFDAIELSNLNRQILYNESDIGSLKPEAAKRHINDFCEKNHIEFITKKFQSSEDIEKVIQDCEIVICVADKPRKDMQGWLNEACVNQNIPFITGGLDTKRAVYCMIIPGITGCIECWKTSVAHHHSLASELLRQENISPVSTAPVPAVVLLVSILTGLMISEFTKWATGISTPQAQGRLLRFDFDTAKIDVAEQWDKNPDCKICGHK